MPSRHELLRAAWEHHGLTREGSHALLADDEDGLAGGVAEDLVEGLELGLPADEYALLSHDATRE